jgi:hypothetical protein
MGSLVVLLGKDHHYPGKLDKPYLVPCSGSDLLITTEVGFQLGVYCVPNNKLADAKYWNPNLVKTPFGW